MNIPVLHPWPGDARSAVRLQNELRDRVREEPLPAGFPEYVAGADVSYERRNDRVFGGVVVMETRRWTVVERAGASGPSPFPYVPGLLSFREIPVLLEAFRALRTTPGVVLFDGQGVAHPRRIGLASHAGLWLDLPTVGCAKSRFIGEHAEPGMRRGCHVALRDRPPGGRTEIVGRVVRTKSGCRPVYVSVGHRITLEEAVRIVLRASRGYRLPEPTRRAHLFVNELRRGESDPSSARISAGRVPTGISCGTPAVPTVYNQHDVRRAHRAHGEV